MNPIKDGTPYTPDVSGGVSIIVVRDDAGTQIADGAQGLARGSAYRAQYVTLLDTNGDPVAIGGGTQYDQDTAATAGQKLNMAGIVRADTPAPQANADGDRTVLISDAHGAAYVTVLDSSGNPATFGGGTQYDQDTAKTADQKLTLAGVVRADTAASQVGADGDRSVLIVDANGRLHAIIPLPSGAATESTVSAISGDLGDTTDAAASGNGSLIAVTKYLRDHIVSSLTVTALQVTASGDTTLISSGTRKLHRIKMSNSHATAAVTAGIKVASLNGGATFDKTYLPALGGQGVWTFPGGFLQVTSEVVAINLSGAGQVEVTAYYE